MSEPISLSAERRRRRSEQEALEAEMRMLIQGVARLEANVDRLIEVYDANNRKLDRIARILFPWTLRRPIVPPR